VAGNNELVWRPLSRTMRYALDILAHLAGKEGEWVPGEQIARELAIPANYLSKILNQLRKGGFVDSQKGWGGGFRLRPEALERPIQDVLRIVEGAIRLEGGGCLLGLASCDEAHPCSLHPYWNRMRETFHEMMTNTRVRDLRR